jgi:sulfate transport system permease protein
MFGTLRRKSVMPGFGITLGISMLYLSVLVLVPLLVLLLRAAGVAWPQFLRVITDPRARAAYALSFGSALAAALLNAVFGVLVAWVLVRYRFPGRKLLNALVDLPFALPTAVAGIALTTLYAPNGAIGKLLAPLGISVAYTPLGIVVALTFVGLPFVVRTVQPVLEDLDSELEEAAATLGASRWTTFRTVLIPSLWPAILTGFSLAFSRALGEYGSVVFIAGNMPMKTEIAPLLIMTKLEQFDYAGAISLAVVMLAVSFVLLFVINYIQTHFQLRKARH